MRVGQPGLPDTPCGSSFASGQPGAVTHAVARDSNAGAGNLGSTNSNAESLANAVRGHELRTSPAAVAGCVRCGCACNPDQGPARLPYRPVPIRELGRVLFLAARWMAGG